MNFINGVQQDFVAHGYSGGRPSTQQQAALPKHESNAMPSDPENIAKGLHTAMLVTCAALVVTMVGFLRKATGRLTGCTHKELSRIMVASASGNVAQKTLGESHKQWAMAAFMDDDEFDEDDFDDGVFDDEVCFHVP